jgi:3-oxoacyl-[acyl-carrier protein] reductase
MIISFDNQQIFITGASRGIGKVIAASFKEAGGKLITPTRYDMDLKDPVSVDNYLSHSNIEPSIIVLNAGINIKAPLEEIKNHQILDNFQVNLFSSIQILRKFIPGMKTMRHGKIIFISSLYAFVSKESRILYSSSKNAITGLIKTLSLELSPYNILTNAVAPGYVMTKMTKQNLTAEEIMEITETIPTKRLQTEEEIANLVLFLTSNLNQSITGQLIAVDGGFLCK